MALFADDIIMAFFPAILRSMIELSLSLQALLFGLAMAALMLTHAFRRNFSGADGSTHAGAGASRERHEAA